MNAGALPLPRFNRGNVLAAVAADVAELIQPRVVPLPDHATCGQVHRRLIRDRRQNAVAQFGDLIQLIVQFPETRGRQRTGVLLHLRDHGKRTAQCQQLARAGGTDGQLGQQPLQIQYLLQQFTDLGPGDGGLEGLLHGIQARVDLGDFHRRPQQALAQQAAAHARTRLVQHADQRRFFALPHEQRLEQFQIAHRHRIQNHGIAALIVSGLRQMIERGFLSLAQIVENRARR